LRAIHINKVRTEPEMEQEFVDTVTQEAYVFAG
jgi:hypothetical protein